MSDETGNATGDALETDVFAISTVFDLMTGIHTEFQGTLDGTGGANNVW